ncbi:unnamed protein product, partial [Callosobruchus maculatus]
LLTRSSKGVAAKIKTIKISFLPLRKQFPKMKLQPKNNT